LNSRSSRLRIINSRWSRWSSKRSARWSSRWSRW